MAEPVQATFSQAALPPEGPLLPEGRTQGRALEVVLSIMATLAALALLFGNGTKRLDARWAAQLSETSTVQVVVPSEALRAAQMAQVEALLREAAPAAEVEVMSVEQSTALLRPWLGDTPLPDDLPVPGTLTVRSGAALPVDTLQRQFEQAGIRARVDDHSRFSSDLRRTVSRLVLLGTALVAMTVAAAMAVSIHATRAGLSAQSDIIHVLVQAGASDGFIARLFVERAARRGALGGAVGGALGLLLWVYVSAGPGRGTVGWDGPAAVAGDALWLLGLVALFALSGAVAAGWAARRQLSDERRRA